MDVSMLCDVGVEIKNPANEQSELVARAQAGDNEAFGLIFEHHSRFIYKFVYAMLGDAELAEELTQETFLAAFRGLQSLRGDAALKTWLCAIAKNTVYKSLRRAPGETGKSEDAAESLDLTDDKNLLPDEQFLNGELNDQIQRALRRLDADKRLVFTLKELQQLSYKEISEITGSQIPKLKTDLHRAKIEMRRALRPYLEANDEL